MGNVRRDYPSTQNVKRKRARKGSARVGQYLGTPNRRRGYFGFTAEKSEVAITIVFKFAVAALVSKGVGNQSGSFVKYCLSLNIHLVQSGRGTCKTNALESNFLKYDCKEK